MLLSPGSTLRGKTSVSNAITVTVFGRNTTGYTPLPQPLCQLALTTSNRLLYTADRDVTVDNIQLVNTTASAVSGVILYLNNIQVAGAFTIPANATFSYANGTWNVDTNTTIFTGVGTNQITVSPTAPLNPAVGDLWLDSSP